MSATVTGRQQNTGPLPRGPTLGLCGSFMLCCLRSGLNASPSMGSPSTGTLSWTKSCWPDAHHHHCSRPPSVYCTLWIDVGYVYGSMSAMGCMWRPEDKRRRESAHSFHCVSPRACRRLVRLESKRFYPLNHPTSSLPIVSLTLHILTILVPYRRGRTMCVGTASPMTSNG